TRSVLWLIERSKVAGPGNIAPPGPPPQAGFIGALRDASGAPLGLPPARWMLATRAAFFGAGTGVGLKNPPRVPATRIGAGFSFRFPPWPEAADDLCRGWRQLRRRSLECTRSSLAAP